MDKTGTPGSTQDTFVVTAVFMTQRTIKAKSVSQALDIAQDTLVEEGATRKDALNWQAHPVTNK